MTTARRRANRTYIGAPWPRGGGSKKGGKMERTKQSREEPERVTLILPLVVKPDGTWAYKFGRMYREKRS